jgi:BTB/POZ domain
LKRKIKIVGHAFVTAIVNVCTTFIAAILQFIIAYHNAPGLGRDRGEARSVTMTNHSGLVTFCVGGLVFTTQLKCILDNSDNTLARLVLMRDDPNEQVFIDRDGTHFRHIVNHFRGFSPQNLISRSGYGDAHKRWASISRLAQRM